MMAPRPSITTLRRKTISNEPMCCCSSRTAIAMAANDSTAPSIQSTPRKVGWIQCYLARPMSDEVYRRQVARLFERSGFTVKSSRVPVSFHPRTSAASPTSRSCPSPRRTSCGRARPRSRRSARTPRSTSREAARIYSTSGTSGTPLYIPLTKARRRGLARDRARHLLEERPQGRRQRRHDLRRRAVRRRRLARRFRGDRRARTSRSGWATPTSCSRRSSRLEPQVLACHAVLRAAHRREAAQGIEDRSIERIIVGGRAWRRRGEFQTQAARRAFGAQGLRNHGHRRHRARRSGASARRRPGCISRARVASTSS